MQTGSTGPVQVNSPDLPPDSIIISFVSNSGRPVITVYRRSMNNYMFHAGRLVSMLRAAGQFTGVSFLYYSKMNGL